MWISINTWPRSNLGETREMQACAHAPPLVSSIRNVGAPMKHFIFAACAALAISGCSTVNHSIGSVQVNHTAQPFPAHYKEAAARAVSGRPLIDGTQLLVSTPATMAGQTMLYPLRWYVCVRGLQPVGAPPVLSTVQRQMENWIDPPMTTGQFDVIVIFQDDHHWHSIEGFDGRLCQNAEFEPL